MAIKFGCYLGNGKDAIRNIQESMAETILKAKPAFAQAVLSVNIGGGSWAPMSLVSCRLRASSFTG